MTATKYGLAQWVLTLSKVYLSDDHMNNRDSRSGGRHHLPRRRPTPAEESKKDWKKQLWEAYDKEQNNFQSKYGGVEGVSSRQALQRRLQKADGNGSDKEGGSEDVIDLDQDSEPEAVLEDKWPHAHPTILQLLHKLESKDRLARTQHYAHLGRALGMPVSTSLRSLQQQATHLTLGEMGFTSDAKKTRSVKASVRTTSHLASFLWMMALIPKEGLEVISATKSVLVGVREVEDWAAACGVDPAIFTHFKASSETKSCTFQPHFYSWNCKDDELVKQAMEGLQVAFSQLKVMAANLWVLWLIAWAPSVPVALKHWLDAKLDSITEFALPTEDNFIVKTKVRLMRLASRLRYLQLHAPNVVKDMFHWGSLRQSLLMKIVPTMERILLDEPSTTWQDLQAFITLEIAKRDSSQVEGMVEVKDAVGTSETGLGRPGIQTIYYQVLGQAPVKAASVDRFEASALLEALDRGSDGKLAEAAAVAKSQMESVCKKNDAKGFGLFATNNWTSQSCECAEIIDVKTLQDFLHYSITDCVSLVRTLSTVGLQFYHPATILFVDGTGLVLIQAFRSFLSSSSDTSTALGSPMLRIDFFTMA
eukprot:g16977.t1